MKQRKRSRTEPLFLNTWIWEKGKRLTQNEDSLYLRSVKTRQGGCFLYGICDGMGGCEYGKEASIFVVERLDEWFEEQLLPLLEKVSQSPFWQRSHRTLARMIKSSGYLFFEEVNQALFQLGRQKRGGYGTTASVCMIFQHHFYIFHVGDSAIFRFPSKKQYKKTCRLTKAHKKENALTRCLGMNPDGRVDFVWGRIDKKECFLLCSDGFYGTKTEVQLQEIFERTGRDETVEEQKKFYQKRLQEIVQGQMRRGEQDNLSAIAVWRSYAV